ncbi:MAG: calcineurin-like phosphoesterase family protein [Pseudomonadales bacterium]
MKIVPICILLFVSLTTQADTATGFVYEDINGDGIRDKGEPGIKDVRVSNGKDVVETNSDGRYEVSIGAEAIVFITKPSNYNTALNSHNLPQFYYIHQPKGSPKAIKFKGIEPTGPLPESINFGLQRTQELSKFEAILLADPQPETDAELSYIRDDLVAELIGSNAQFGMSMGDLLYDDLSMFPRYNSIIAQVGVPWYNVAGNHELNLNAQGDKYSLETFKRYFGPAYYSFEYGDVVFIVLDNIVYQGGGVVTADNLRGNGGYIAKFDETQLKWLKNELSFIANDKLIFVAMHSPLKNSVSDRVTSNTSNKEKLFKLLKNRKHLYSVAGHTHTTEHVYFGPEDGFKGETPFHHHILTTVSGSWWSGPFDERGIPSAVQIDGTPNGYHILEIDGVKATVRFKAAGAATDFQMRIMFDKAQRSHTTGGMRDYRLGQLLDGQVNVDALFATSIIVNVFDGGPRTKVSYTVAGRAPIEMTKVFLKDPHANELAIRYKDERQSWAAIVPSTHLWSAELPAGLTAGTYTVSVVAIDEFGRSHHSHRILEILGSSATPLGVTEFK